MLIFIPIFDCFDVSQSSILLLNTVYKFPLALELDPHLVYIRFHIQLFNLSVMYNATSGDYLQISPNAGVGFTSSEDSDAGVGAAVTTMVEASASRAMNSLGKSIVGIVEMVDIVG